MWQWCTSFDVGDVNNSDSGCTGGGDGEVDGGSNDEGSDIVIMMMVRAKLVVALIWYGWWCWR